MHFLKQPFSSPVFPSVALLLVVAACGDAPDEVPPPMEEPEPAAELVDPRMETYATELRINIDEMETTASGVYFRIDEPGDGEEAESGRTVAIHYTGYLPDGSAFDSSREQEQPFTIQLGAGQVIPGFEHGIEGMQVGERRTVIIPPHLAYGAQGAGAGVIPPNAVLIFDLELMDVE